LEKKRLNEKVLSIIIGIIFDLIKTTPSPFQQKINYSTNFISENDTKNISKEMIMITTELIAIKEQLDRIEKKLNGSFKNKFLGINEVAKLVSVSTSTIRRAVIEGELKCSRKLGKLLFQESDVRKWING
tara:strand:+ start:193 stop:582 length:390 start_codon:yes stop_codon:yes gene_type:complete